VQQDPTFCLTSSIVDLTLRERLRKQQSLSAFTMFTHYRLPYNHQLTYQIATIPQTRSLMNPMVNKSQNQHTHSFSAQKCSPPTSPNNRPNKKPRTFRNPNAPFLCCAVCLRRNPHHVIDCAAALTWDGKHDTISERIHKALWTKDGKQLCTAWQREEGCDSTKHNNRHTCSGCRATTHGAQSCPRAQKA
jgi:hypothetical protein